MAPKRTFGMVFLQQQIGSPNSNFGHKTSIPQLGLVYSLYHRYTLGWVYQRHALGYVIAILGYIIVIP